MGFVRGVRRWAAKKILTNARQKSSIHARQIEFNLSSAKSRRGTAAYWRSLDSGKNKGFLNEAEENELAASEAEARVKAARAGLARIRNPARRKARLVAGKKPVRKK